MISRKVKRLISGVIITFMVVSNTVLNVSVHASARSTVNSSVKARPTITFIDDISATVTQNDRYTMPKAVKATMSDGSTKSVSVKWNPSRISTSKAGTFTCAGIISGYSGSIKLNLTVNPLPTIESIDDISVIVTQNDKYTLPKTVTATMSDGSTKSVAVKWNPSRVSTSKAGIFTYTGIVSGYSSNAKLNLTVNPLPTIKSIDDINVIVTQNDKYTLPKTVTAMMSEGSTKSIAVKWNPSRVSTSKAGIFTYTGIVSGYSNNAKLNLTVNPLPTIKSIDDIEAVVTQNDRYTMPKTVTATMSDGSTKVVSVRWSSSSAKTNKVGKCTYTGTVTGYSGEVKLTVLVNPLIISISDISVVVTQNDRYILPSTVTAIMSDKTSKNVNVLWERTVIDTTRIGTYKVIGIVEGYSKKVSLNINVVEVQGNTNGNLRQKGMVAEKDGWIYFNDVYNNNKFYKFNLNTKESVKINDDDAYYINVVRNSIYYCNKSDGSKIYKVDLDGSHRTKISADKASNLHVVGNWIYYGYYVGLENGDYTALCRMKIDGTEKIMSKYPVDDGFDIVNGWIYANEKQISKLYKIKSDFTATDSFNLKEKLGDELINKKVDLIGIENNCIYYFNNYDKKCWKISTDGKHNALIKNLYVNSSGMVVDGWIYVTGGNGAFNSFEYSTGLIKSKIDGTNKTTILDNTHLYDYFYVMNGWIYTINTYGREIYRVKLDGSGQEYIRY